MNIAGRSRGALYVGRTASSKYPGFRLTIVGKSAPANVQHRPHCVVQCCVWCVDLHAPHQAQTDLLEANQTDTFTRQVAGSSSLRLCYKDITAPICLKPACQLSKTGLDRPGCTSAVSLIVLMYLQQQTFLTWIRNNSACRGLEDAIKLSSG